MSSSIDLGHPSQAPAEPKQWTLVLDQYQRDNLLWLLNAIGYPYGNVGTVEPFTLANTGDWVGEIALKLAGDNGTLSPERPNVSVGALKDNVAFWLKTRSGAP